MYYIWMAPWWQPAVQLINLKAQKSRLDLPWCFSLQAHKALLATQSDYFRVMFTADMRERDQDKIHMKGLTAAGFGHILRFMYYGSLELSMPTVQEILQVGLQPGVSHHVLQKRR